MIKFEFKRVFGIILIAFMGVSCHENRTRISFYHWETSINLTQEESEFLDDQVVTEVYVRYFDLTVLPTGLVGPIAIADFKTIPTQDIIPVVYITTSVFVASDSSEIEELARLTAKKINAMHPKSQLDEVQIDCDWMPSIKDRYFYFLTCLDTEFETVSLSSTIRLYQYKYPELAGVPPVDKGVLMYYNMGSLTDYDETNSILNNDVGKQYLGFGDYPLPLDFALPLFSWTLRFRYGTFSQIMPNLGLDQLLDTNLFEKTSDNYFVLKQDTLLDGSFLRLGDEFRHEACAEEVLQEAARLLAREKNQDETTLIFYDLKPNIVHETATIDRVHATFK